MAIKNWTTNSPTAPDTATEQPPVVNAADDMRSTQINTMRDVIHVLQARVGSDNLEAGTLRQKLAMLTAAPTPTPVLEWSSVTTINAVPSPGAPTTMRLSFQDGKTRSASVSESFVITTSGEGGRSAGSETSDTWYRLFAVPKGSDDDLWVLVGEDTDPETGPTGYTNFVYLGAVRNNASSNLLRFTQDGPCFFYQVQTDWTNIISDTSPTAGSWFTVPLADAAPPEAGAVFVRALLNTTTGSDVGQVTLTASDGIPGWTPSGSIGVHLIIANTSGARECNARWIQTVDGNLYYRWTFLSGGGPFVLFVALAGWEDKYLSAGRANRYGVAF